MNKVDKCSKVVLKNIFRFDAYMFLYRKWDYIMLILIMWEYNTVLLYKIEKQGCRYLI